MSEKSNGVRKMDRVAYWATEIELIAGPRLANDTRESWLARAARRAGITFRQCKALYYGEMIDPKVSVAIGVVAAAQAARREASALASRFENAAGGLNAIDKDFHGADIAALIYAARRLRGDDRPG